MRTMDFTLGFYKDTTKASISDKNLLGILKPNILKTDIYEAEEIKKAILKPIGTKPLNEVVKPKEKVVIITSDITRPMPSKLVLPEVINQLLSAEVELQDITIVFALGSHRKHTAQEMKYLVGDKIYGQINCIDSDIDDCVHLGTTSYGTPVDIFRPVVQADRRICIGNIEYHYFAGYSGGVKAIMPGVSSRATIQANHSRMVMQEARTGNLQGNPVRKDIDEVADFVPIDFIVNVVLDEKKNIIKVGAGHHIEAHREGCQFLDQIYKVKIAKKADIVVVSAGGYPKDINLYQAQKALDNAKHAVKKGGIIILVASCKEGLGEKVFERWILNATTPESMVDKIQKEFELGGHKAAAIGMVLGDIKIFLVSHLEDGFVRKIFMEPFRNVEQALNEAFRQLGSDAKVFVMPYGGSTLPALED